jgi:hypothetical protein
MPGLSDFLVIASASVYIFIRLYSAVRDNDVKSAVLEATVIVGFLLAAHWTLGFFPMDGRISKGFDNSVEFPNILLLYVAMVAGMLSQHLYTWLQDGKRVPFRPRAFLAPVFVAPIVFIPFYNSVRLSWADPSVRWLIILVAYENGFFFKNTFEHRRQIHARATRAR